MDQTTKRGGRPPKSPDQRRRATLNFRARDALREWLVSEAARERRSMSEEIEFRLEQLRASEGLMNRYFDTARKPPLDDDVEEKSFHPGWFRIPDNLKQDLYTVAQRNRVTIDDEIEFRLSESLSEVRTLADEAIPENLLRAVRWIMTTLHNLEIITGREVFGPAGDPWLHSRAWRAIATWFAATRPPGEMTAPPDPLDGTYLATLDPGLISAIGELVMVKELTQPGWFGIHWGGEIRSALDELDDLAKAGVAQARAQTLSWVPPNPSSPNPPDLPKRDAPPAAPPDHSPEAAAQARQRFKARHARRQQPHPSDPSKVLNDSLESLEPTDAPPEANPPDNINSPDKDRTST